MNTAPKAAGAMIIEIKVEDPKLAAKLLSNPIKNKTLLFMFVTTLGVQSPWMLVDGCFKR